MTADNVEELIDLAGDDPDLAAEVLDGIADVIDSVSATEATTLQVAALDVAATASGVGTAVLGAAGDVVDILGSDTATEDDIIAVVSDALGGLSGLSSSAEDLVAILPDPATEPEAFEAFVAEADAEQLAMAAVVLLAAEASSSSDGIEGYIDTFDPDTVSTTSATLAVALAEEAATKYEESGATGDLATILEDLNLLSGS